MKTNTKAVDRRKDTDTRLAGGYGPYAAKQDAEALLRRSVMANLLWENQFYEDGQSVADNIRALIPQVDPQIVFDIAVEARTKQKLRHVPLLIAREMARLSSHKSLVGHLLPKIILRSDEITEFVALYWKNGKCPLSKQVKKGLAVAFDRFDAYQFAKYNRQTRIKLRDIMFLVHPKPIQGREELYKQIANDTLPTPDTWEVGLSTGQDKKEVWTRLIAERKIGAMAFVRNLRNMENVGVSQDVIRQGFETINSKWLLPINYLAAAKAAPRYERELETLMLHGLDQAPKLPGRTIFVVDVSGSMYISNNSQFTRMEVAAAMAILAAEMCEHISVYATAGSDSLRQHATGLIPNRRGFGLSDAIIQSADQLGGGGIFTRQCLEYIAEREGSVVHPNRIIIFSDSQDCDSPHLRIPSPFGIYNYIIDVSAHSRGISYDDIWTAEVSGWSEHFLTYIAEIEKMPELGHNKSSKFE